MSSGWVDRVGGSGGCLGTRRVWGSDFLRSSWTQLPGDWAALAWPGARVPRRAGRGPSDSVGATEAPRPCQGPELHSP